MTKGERLSAALFVVAVGALAVADRLVPHRATTPPVATADAGVVSLASYCPVPKGEDATASTVTANAGDRPVTIRRSAVGEQRSTTPQAGEVPPGAAVTADRPEGIGESGIVVESFAAPATTASAAVARSAGAALAPCTLEPGTRWLFASGSTLRGHDTYLLILNPFGEDAAVGIRLLTPEGPVPLPRLRELTVRPFSQTVVWLSDYHPEDESFGIDVTVSRGRLVVVRSIRLAPRGGPRGLSLAGGVPAPATRWQFAAGEVPHDGEELILLANPGDREALVQVVFQTDAEQVAAQELEEIPVPPGGHVAVPVSQRLARGTHHGTTVLSTNGEPVVTERLTTASAGALRGTETVPGVEPGHRRWVVALGTPAGGSQQLALVNTGPADATASVTILTAGGTVRPDALAAVPVGAGRRTTVDVTPHTGARPVVALVEGSGPGIVPEGRTFLGEPYLDFADTPPRPWPW